MGGMEMMLKALGLDPADLKKRGDELFQEITAFRVGMDALNTTQTATLQAVLRIENRLSGGLELPDTALAVMPRDELTAMIDAANQEQIN